MLLLCVLSTPFCNLATKPVLKLSCVCFGFDLLTLHTCSQTDSPQISSPLVPLHPDASWSGVVPGLVLAVQRAGETPPSAG